MKNQIDERIEIIDGFKSMYNWEVKTEDGKGKKLKFIASLIYGLVIVLLVFLILVSVLTSFQVESHIVNWEKSGLLVLMTMSLSLIVPVGYIELILKRHIQEIRNIKIDFDKRLNHDLEFIISKFNDRRKYPYLIELPTILILIAALLQVLDINPFWDKLPHFIGGVSIYILARMNYDIVKLKKNLRRVKLSQHSS